MGWYGVSAYQGHVIQLFLSNNRLTGTIPSSFTELKYLTSVGLTYNSLSGQFPEVFKSLIQLKGVDLTDNLFSGSVPEWVGNMNSVFLGDNNFSGGLHWSKLPSTYMFINLNGFTFSDLLPEWASYTGTFDYTNQHIVDEERSVIGPKGGQATFSALVDRGTNSKYQWFQRVNATGEVIVLTEPTENDYTYTVTNIDESDINSTFYYQITNSLLLNLHWLVDHRN